MLALVIAGVLMLPPSVLRLKPELTKQARFEGFINGYKAAMAGTDVAEALNLLQAA